MTSQSPSLIKPARGPRPARVLVFDSGVGGLSVVDEIRLILPGVALAYVADDGFFPYGSRSEAALIDRVGRVVQAAIERLTAEHGAPDLIVIACNTASTVVLPDLRAQVSVPVVGVVPAIKPAAAVSARRAIGLLGTPGTVSRRYTQDLIDQFAADCQIWRQGSGDLVEIAERALDGIPPEPAALAAILAPFFASPIAAVQPDVIVLACTHFPLLAADLAAVAPAGTRFIDSGAAIARRVQSLLPPGCADPTGSPRPNPGPAWFTAAGSDRPQRAAAFRRRGFADPLWLPV